MMPVALTRLFRKTALFGLAVALSACDNPPALGNINQILVVSSTDLWTQVRDDMYEALEPQTFTVRDERVFDIAHAEPDAENWERLSVLRQILLMGTADFEPIAAAIRAYRGEVPPAPGVFQVGNLWARNQIVTVVLLTPGGDAATEVRTLLPELGELYLRQFQEYAHSRMFVSGVNESLADSLRQNVGFSLTVPTVYRFSEAEPGVFLFRNDQPDPSSLIRNIVVTHRPRAEVELSEETAVAWREEIATRTTTPPQVTETLPGAERIEVNAREGIQIRGVWTNPPGEYPAAGPFFTRLVSCGDQVYLLDAWLYAPGVAKYEYMFQLNAIADSFTC